MWALAFLALTIFSTSEGYSEEVGNEFIAPQSWTYPALRRLEALGLVELPSEALFTRRDVVGYVGQIHKRITERDVTLSARDAYNLDRLDKEYASQEAQSDPKTRFDPPIVYATDAPLYVEGDVSFSLAPTKPLLESGWDVFFVTDPSLRLSFRDWVTWDVRYRVTAGPETDDRVDRAKPTSREKSWHGVTSLYERGYLVSQWKTRLTVFWGRDYVDYGPSQLGNTFLSNTAGSLDKWGLRIDFRNLRFSGINATLSAADDRRFAAHRLEIRLGPSVIGLSEGVVYAGRGFDPIYVLPLSSFYSNQFNEQGDDNVIWGMDAKVEVADAALVYASLLIDDFQFDRSEPFPDKLAFDIGGRVAISRPFASTIRFQYRYVDIYTYTHDDTTTYWLTGNAEPNLDTALGAAQGPDADTAFLDVEVYPIPSLTTNLTFQMARRGQGNDWQMFETGDPVDPPFPSGVVQTTVGFGLGVEWELRGNSSLGASVFQAHVDNLDHQPDDDEWTTSVLVHLTWDLGR